jgi:hypothetical protein
MSAVAFQMKRYIRTNKRKTGSRIDYGDVIGMKTSFLITSFANRVYYTIMSGSTGMGLGAGFAGSILLFAQPVLGASASVPSNSAFMMQFVPLISGNTYLGVLGYYLSNGASILTSMSAETAAFRYTILVVSR